jgi:predicted nucleotidyltransferase component of viral defense system
MKEKKLKNMAASVKSRLLNLSRKSGKPFQELLIHYGLERFLYRLSRSSFRDKFILKGGLLLAGMGISQARTTRDIDFLGLIPADSRIVAAHIKQIGEVISNDGLSYDFTDLNTEAMADDSEYPGIRLKFSAWLGKAMFPMQIDVGFGDVMISEAKEMTYPTLLDMEAPIVLVYSLETIVAEKYEASLDLADVNSRMKDFYDLWILSRKYHFQGLTLQEAIEATCKQRNTLVNAEAEIFLHRFAGRPDKQSQWLAFLRRSHLSDSPKAFTVIMADIGSFLRPVASAIEKGIRFRNVWPPGGPWRLS